MVYCVVPVAQEERAAANEVALPSLVVCPQTLVLHWAHEVHKFAGNAIKTLPYQGSPAVHTPSTRIGISSRHCFLLLYPTNGMLTSVCMLGAHSSCLLISTQRIAPSVLCNLDGCCMFRTLLYGEQR